MVQISSEPILAAAPDEATPIQNEWDVNLSSDNPKASDTFINVRINRKGKTIWE